MNDVRGVGHLVGELAADDRGTRSRAAAALVALGSAAVPAVVAALVDEASPVDWGDAGMVLRRIGLPAVNAVREAIAAAPTQQARRRAGWALVGFGAAALAGYVAATRHPHPQVRADAATGIGYLNQQGLPGTAALVDLLADSDQQVRERAVAGLLLTCRRLAGRYGTAQAFAYDELSGWSAWTVADDHPALFALSGEPPGLGRIVRHHLDDEQDGGGADVGQPLAVAVACAGRGGEAEGAPGCCSARPPAALGHRGARPTSTLRRKHPKEVKHRLS